MCRNIQGKQGKSLSKLCRPRSDVGLAASDLGLHCLSLIQQFLVVNRLVQKVKWTSINHCSLETPKRVIDK